MRVLKFACRKMLALPTVFYSPPRGANDLVFMFPSPWGGSTSSVSVWFTDYSQVDLPVLRHESVNVEVRKGPVAPIVLRSKPASCFTTPDLWRGGADRELWRTRGVFPVRGRALQGLDRAE